MSSTKHSENAPRAARDREGETPLSREEAARYIGAMTAELCEIARRADLDLLAYFLEMAGMEARELLKAGDTARGKS